MKAREFNILNPFYKSVNNKITFGRYHYQLVRCDFPKYHFLKNKLAIIKELDFSDYITCRAVLNARYFGTKSEVVKDNTYLFNEVRNRIFKYLDTVDNPYLYLLNPYYEFGGNESYNSYTLNEDSGLNNLDIAFDYCKYKAKNFLLNN